MPSIAQALIAKLGKNEYVALEVLEKICIALDCDIGDIVEARTKGSHIQLKHPSKPGKVTVTNHKGDIAPGTLNSILKQAGLK